MDKRLIILALGLFVLSTGIIWLMSVQRIEDETENITILNAFKAQDKLDEVEAKFLDLYDNSRRNVLLLAELISLDIEGGNSTDDIKNQLSKFLTLNDNYFQVRFIDTLGMEKVRVENNLPFGQEVALQYKGDRYYFNETARLQKGDIFISYLDLNVENGEVEVPYRPTVRFFTPIYINDKFGGVAGFNLNANSWFNSFSDKEVNVINSRDEVFFGDHQPLYTNSKVNLDEKDPYGNALYFYKEISLAGYHNWTVYLKANNADYRDSINSFKTDVYRTAIILTAGLLLLLYIIYMMYKKNVKISTLNTFNEVSLRERNTLLKEIHHRVKNNLQVITSLLSLQSSFIQDQKTKSLFKQSQYRINSMAIIHEMLYQSNDLRRINYDDYLRQLVSALIISMKGSESRITMEVSAKDILLNIDTSIPLGLLINEIVTNSLKYAFKEGEPGVISIEIQKLTYPNFVLLIGDNGEGYTKPQKVTNRKPLGLKLIEKLAKQLKGGVERDFSLKGTHYVIKFQEIEQTS